MKELLQNAYEMDSKAPEVLENANQISFDMDEMFSPLTIDPEKLSQKEKDKYISLNEKLAELWNRITSRKNPYPGARCFDYIGTDYFIEVTNPDNWKKYKLYPYIDPAEQYNQDFSRFPYVPQLIVSKDWEVIANSQLTAADYETALKKIEKVLDKLEEGRKVEVPDVPM